MIIESMIKIDYKTEDELIKKLVNISRSPAAEQNRIHALRILLESLPGIDHTDTNCEQEAPFTARDGSVRSTDLVFRTIPFEVKIDAKDLEGQDPNSASTQIQRRLEACPDERCGWCTDGDIWIRWERYQNGFESYKYLIYQDLFNVDSSVVMSVIRQLIDDAQPRLLPPDDEARIYEIFHPLRTHIETLIQQKSTDESLRLKADLWAEQLRGAHMTIPDFDDEKGRTLFARHCLLIAIARLIIHPSLPSDKAISEDSGFTDWLASSDRDITECRDYIATQIRHYDWRQAKGDVLKHLYHALIDRTVRFDFGEYYTPDWLAEEIVKQCLDEDWCRHAIEQAHRDEQIYPTGVLDPSCGSGTFLRAAAKRLLTFTVQAGYTPLESANIVARLVHGFDIHPVAIELARATLAIALQKKPTEPLRIYLSDALRLGTDDSLWTQEDGLTIGIPNDHRTLTFPPVVLNHRDFDSLIGCIASHWVRFEEIDTVFSMFCLDPDSHDGKSLRKTAETLQELRNEKRNGVWAWFIRNLAQPYRLEQAKVDRIVGNPPWITYNDWSLKRQEALTTLAKEMKVWVGGKSAPQMDLASIFAASTVLGYLDLKPEAKARFAFVLPRSALKGNAWKRFRTAEWNDHITFEEILPWFVDTDPPAFTQVSGCSVFFGCYGEARSSNNDSNNHDSNNHDSLPYMTLSGSPEALEWNLLPSFLEQESPFLESTRNGATLCPKNLVCVRHRDIEKSSYTKVKVTTYTSPRTKAPWKIIGPQTVSIEEATLIPFIDANDLLPFRRLQQNYVILPPDCMPQGQFSGHAMYWLHAERLWKDNRKAKSPPTLAKQVNYNKKLTTALANAKPTVFYNKSGSSMSAVVVQKPQYLPHSEQTYRVMTETFEEAYFLATLLNSDSLQGALFACRTTDRHFDTLPFQKIPFPRYDSEDVDHQQLSKLAKQAEAYAAKVVIDPDKTLQARQRIREALRHRGLMQQMDTLIGRILPDYTARSSKVSKDNRI